MARESLEVWQEMMEGASLKGYTPPPFQHRSFLRRQDLFYACIVVGWILSLGVALVVDHVLGTSGTAAAAIGGAFGCAGVAGGGMFAVRRGW